MDKLTEFMYTIPHINPNQISARAADLGVVLSPSDKGYGVRFAGTPFFTHWERGDWDNLYADWGGEILPLEASIEKWRILADERYPVLEDNGAETCGLCRHYDACDGCPVLAKTGEYQCQGTSYYKYRYCAANGTQNEAKQAARDMHTFLVSLR